MYFCVPKSTLRHKAMISARFYEGVSSYETVRHFSSQKTERRLLAVLFLEGETFISTSKNDVLIFDVRVKFLERNADRYFRTIAFING